MHRFPISLPLLSPDPDPGERLPPIGDPGLPTRSRELVCEHCQCRLTPHGDVLRMSDVARAHNKHAETLAKRDERIATLETELREAKAKIAELTPAAKSGMFDLSL